MTTRAPSTTWAALALTLLGCQSLLLPGWLPPLTPPQPIVPEPTMCGAHNYPALVPLPEGPIKGAADFHNHQFANLGFGGRLLAGKAFDERGVEHALSVCGAEGLCVDDREAAVCRLACAFATDGDGCRAKCDGAKCSSSPPHGHFGWSDPVGMALGQGYGHVVRGYPEFQGWPNYNTYTHQQEYYTWLHRAFQGGLKLMVMLAVTNETLCQFLGHDHPCDDMTNVDLQLAEARKLEAFIDEQGDCEVNGNGWYRIAESPAQARKIIEDGAMAVVLGIEVDTLFNCRQSGNCNEASVVAQIQKYKAKGVRHVFPVHLMDNGIGGAATVNDFFNFGNVVVNHRQLAVRDCKSEGYSFRFGSPSMKANEVLHAMASKLGVDYPDYSKESALGAHCNKLGLDPKLGAPALAALMNARMLVDVDHMSALSRREALAVAKTCNYPGVVSGHSGFTKLTRGQEQSEGQLRDDDVTSIVERGGLFAPILNQGSREELIKYEREGSKVEHDCGSSAKSFAQAYLYAVDAVKARKQGPVGVGFGSDINGFAGLPAPRFGPYACGGDGVPQTNAVSYPFQPLHGSVTSMERFQAGYRVFDINLDGFAHMGLFPDFVQELLAIGLTPHDLEPLFDSAEAYIQMWDAAEKRTLSCDHAGKPLPPAVPPP